jgi:hypothetical protein
MSAGLPFEGYHFPAWGARPSIFMQKSHRVRRACRDLSATIFLDTCLLGTNGEQTRQNSCVGRKVTGNPQPSCYRGVGAASNQEHHCTKRPSLTRCSTSIGPVISITKVATGGFPSRCRECQRLRVAGRRASERLLSEEVHLHGAIELAIVERAEEEAAAYGLPRIDAALRPQSQRLRSRLSSDNALWQPFGRHLQMRQSSLGLGRSRHRQPDCIGGAT